MKNFLDNYAEACCDFLSFVDVLTVKAAIVVQGVCMVVFALAFLSVFVLPAAGLHWLISLCDER